MKMKNNCAVNNTNSGYTLIEAMVATAIASIMSLSVVSIYVNQSANISSETQRDTSIQEANRAFDIISRLLRQARQNTILIDYGSGALNQVDEPETSSDSINVRFNLPQNFRVWPNTSGINPAVEISWQNTGDNSYLIRVANATDFAGLNNQQTIAGDNAGNEARIVNLDIWPMADLTTPQALVTAAPTGGYLLRVTTRSANPDLGYVNLDDGSNFRTHTVAGIISPRN